MGITSSLWALTQFENERNRIEAEQADISKDAQNALNEMTIKAEEETKSGKHRKPRKESK